MILSFFFFLKCIARLQKMVLWERKMFVGPTRLSKLQRASQAKIEYKNITRGNNMEK